MEKTAWLPLGRHRPNTLPKRAVERREESRGDRRRGGRIEDISKDRRRREEGERGQKRDTGEERVMIKGTLRCTAL